MKVKNRMARILGVMLCVVMLFGLCSVGVAAISAIDKVYVTGIDAPIPGQAPDYNGVLPVGANYVFDNYYEDDDTKNGITWQDATTGEFLDPDTAVFAEGHQDTVYATLTPKAGYCFLLGADGFEGYLNGNLSMEGGSAGNVCNVVYTFPVEAVDKVAIYELETPAAGMVPDMRAVVSDHRYDLRHMEWYDVTDDAPEMVMPGTLFQAGHTYQVIFELIATDGYRFAVDASEQRTAVTATVNGANGQVQAGDDAKTTIYVIKEYAIARGGNPFDDVKSADYYYDPVLWAVEKGITNGMAPTTFAPDNDCTRGQIVTFLWRAYGCPAPSEKVNPFTDVKSTDYYYDAVLWAVGEGITTGMTATTFGPDLTCTRAQAVTFLWRAEGEPDVGNLLLPFLDIPAGAYYINAVIWAVFEEITNGTGPSTFSPDKNCTRGQIVTFLWRCMEA
ncbi:MAG: S-layer homology domain-containing protein [Firmicutes bacterium]|nr:S-layer homology domain-containing protein [Bacillota bacterium]